MTVEAFRERCCKTRKTVIHWIEKGYIPGADLQNDYVPDSAKPPFAEARAYKCVAYVFTSIVCAILCGKHVLPDLYKMCQEEFDSYINQLIEAELITTRTTDGILYYDPTLKAEQKTKKGIRILIKACVESVSKSLLVVTG